MVARRPREAGIAKREGGQGGVLAQTGILRPILPQALAQPGEPDSLVVSQPPSATDPRPEDLVLGRLNLASLQWLLVDMAPDGGEHLVYLDL